MEVAEVAAASFATVFVIYALGLYAKNEVSGTGRKVASGSKDD